MNIPRNEAKEKKEGKPRQSRVGKRRGFNSLIFKKTGSWSLFIGSAFREIGLSTNRNKYQLESKYTDKYNGEKIF